MSVMMPVYVPEIDVTTTSSQGPRTGSESTRLDKNGSKTTERWRCNIINGTLAGVRWRINDLLLKAISAPSFILLEIHGDNGLLSGAAEQITGIRDYHSAPIKVELYPAGFPFSYPHKVVCSVP
jgi:hypothetical protein